MNPFYAPDFQSLQMSPMRAALEPMPLYQPRNTGYMGIYNKPMEKESPAISSVLKGLSASIGPTGTGEGSREDPATAGGTAVSDINLSRGRQGALLGTIASLATGIPFGGLVGGGLGTLADINEVNAALAQAAQTNPDLAARGAFGQLSPSQGFSGFIDAVTGGRFGTPIDYSFVDQAIAGTPPSRGTTMGIPDEAADIQATIDQANRDAATQASMDAAVAGAQAAAESSRDTSSGQGAEWARGGYVPGKSGGMDDDVPAIIDGKQPARLSSGEFVFDAATVAALGDGNNAAGAKKLDGLRKAIRQKAYGHERQPPKNYSVGDLVRAYDRSR